MASRVSLEAIIRGQFLERGYQWSALPNIKGQEWGFLIAVFPQKDTRKFNEIECNKACKHHHEMYFFAYIRQVHDLTTE